MRGIVFFLQIEACLRVVGSPNLRAEDRLASLDIINILGQLDASYVGERLFRSHLLHEWLSRSDELAALPRACVQSLFATMSDVVVSASELLAVDGIADVVMLALTGAMNLLVTWEVGSLEANDTEDWLAVVTFILCLSVYRTPLLMNLRTS